MHGDERIKDVSYSVSNQCRSRANVQKVWVGPQNHLWAPLGNIFENKSNIWRGVKFHSWCEPRCSVIQWGCQQVSPQLLSDHPGSAACWCAVAPWSPLQMSAHLQWVVGRIGVNERLRGMFPEPRTSVWALFKRAAGDSGKSSPFSLGLTWIGTAYSGMVWKGWQSGHPWSLPHRLSGLRLSGLCKVHGVSGNLETLHNSETVYVTIKAVSNQVIEINGSDAFFGPFIGFLSDDLVVYNF